MNVVRHFTSRSHRQLISLSRNGPRRRQCNVAKWGHNNYHYPWLFLKPINLLTICFEYNYCRIEWGRLPWCESCFRRSQRQGLLSKTIEGIKNWGFKITAGKNKSFGFSKFKPWGATCAWSRISQFLSTYNYVVLQLKRFPFIFWWLYFDFSFWRPTLHKFRMQMHESTC